MLQTAIQSHCTASALVARGSSFTSASRTAAVANRSLCSSLAPVMLQTAIQSHCTASALFARGSSFTSASRTAAVAKRSLRSSLAPLVMLQTAPQSCCTASAFVTRGSSFTSASRTAAVANRSFRFSLAPAVMLHTAVQSFLTCAEFPMSELLTSSPNTKSVFDTCDSVRTSFSLPCDSITSMSSSTITVVLFSCRIRFFNVRKICTLALEAGISRANCRNNLMLGTAPAAARCLVESANRCATSIASISITLSTHWTNSSCVTAAVLWARTDFTASTSPVAQAAERLATFPVACSYSVDVPYCMASFAPN